MGRHYPRYDYRDTLGRRLARSQNQPFFLGSPRLPISTAFYTRNLTATTAAAYNLCIKIKSIKERASKQESKALCHFNDEMPREPETTG